MTHAAPESPVVPDALALQRERSMLLAALSDLVLIAGQFTTAVFANSLMMLAEAVRAFLLVVLELVLLGVLRRIHRGRMHDFDYGAGKVEQFANLSVALGMGLAGLWVGAGAAYRWWHPPEQVEAGLVFAVAVGALNALQNAYVFRALWRAGGDGRSVIMMGQVRTRLAKLISSAIVLVALTVNASFPGGTVALVAEVAGSGFVALVMVQLAVSMARQSLPSLLDRTLEEKQQHLINRALVRHFDRYDALVSVRSRLSGNMPCVDVVLGFAPERRMDDVQGVTDQVAGEVQALIPGAQVTVTPVLSPAAPA